MGLKPEPGAGLWRYQPLNCKPLITQGVISATELNAVFVTTAPEDLAAWVYAACKSNTVKQVDAQEKQGAA
ncbi:hypothetical protein WJX72_007900 [[Myrmecia] bisecta]|uniref:Uncharacterized protein n=1 Tax=[Myrmecia] bisecta TaxID=41462 RepID=A0AAW1P8U5_9CHLO